MAHRKFTHVEKGELGFVRRPRPSREPMVPALQRRKNGERVGAVRPRPTGSGISDQRAKGRIARAGLRQMKRPYPSGGKIKTPFGRVHTRKVFEQSLLGPKVDYVSTYDKDYPGSTGEPKTYADIGRHITPKVAGKAVDMPRSGYKAEDEGPDARRSGATAIALAWVSETQRNGGRKHARAALRTIARGRLRPDSVYDGKTPAFPQARRRKVIKTRGKTKVVWTGGMDYHRKVMAGEEIMTPEQREVVFNMSSSSGDESVAELSDRSAIRKYRTMTETAARKKLAPEMREMRRRREAKAEALSSSSSDSDTPPPGRRQHGRKHGRDRPLGRDRSSAASSDAPRRDEDGVFTRTRLKMRRLKKGVPEKSRDKSK